MVIIILVVFGLCLGSFIYNYVWRAHKRKSSDKFSDLSVWKGRSMCPNCSHTLASIDLIPVFSWLILRGKCRYCKKPISRQYPAVELVVAFLFVSSYLYWPIPFNSEGVVLFVFWLLFILGFVALTVFDLKWKILPNQTVFPLIALALLEVLIKLIFFHGGFSLIIGSVFGLLFSAGLFYVLFIISKGAWIGGGDVKLAIALGLLLGGPSEALLMIFLSALIGCLTSFTLMLGGRIRLSSKIAFGPMLLAATIICYLFGVHTIDWYKNIVF